MFGNKTDQQTRTYENLTTPDLHRIVENLAVRLPVFGGAYPAFMPQMVKAVMEHPNLSQADSSALDTYCQMFELDWRGDQAAVNKASLLS